MSITKSDAKAILFTRERIVDKEQSEFVSASKWIARIAGDPSLDREAQAPRRIN
ncbi:MAG: hypothetical protein H7Y43_08280 [Akkermansiaceae bacterium]|nr:hypothetical protein [Verrucomicrobiales bacterium]